MRPRTSYRCDKAPRKRSTCVHARRACATSTGWMERHGASGDSRGISRQVLDQGLPGASAGDSSGIARLRFPAAGATPRTRELTPAAASAAQAGLRASAVEHDVVPEAGLLRPRGPPCNPAP